MKQILVLMPSRGTHDASPSVAADLRLRGFTPAAHARPPSTGAYEGVLLASVHAGPKKREMVASSRSNRSRKTATAFISVSLSEAGAEMQDAPPERREAAEKGVKEMIGRFLEETGFLPTHVKPVAGALLYTKYNVLIRLVMKHIAKQSGGSTDTSRDHEYTDWAALDRFVSEFAASLE